VESESNCTHFSNLVDRNRLYLSQRRELINSQSEIRSHVTDKASRKESNFSVIDILTHIRPRFTSKDIRMFSTKSN
jgi:glutamate racemase